jgi:hypothetical protein
MQFNGYDLASLSNEYASTLVGRNILFSQKLMKTCLRQLILNKRTIDELEPKMNSKNGVKICPGAKLVDALL